MSSDSKIVQDSWLERFAIAIGHLAFLILEYWKSLTGKSNLVVLLNLAFF
jgi:hypothetical protein